MNDLNSVLLEGVLIDDPVRIGNSGCNFNIKSTRFYKVEGTPVQEVSIYAIETFGKFADICLTTIKKGRCVRVVGRLRQYPETKNIVIFAEHIEFKSSKSDV
jgi:single-strand DNA-binding protein